MTPRPVLPKPIEPNHSNGSSGAAAYAPPNIRKTARSGDQGVGDQGKLKAALDDLLRQYPAMGPKLFADGKLRPYINVFLNDEDIRYLDEMDTALTDGVVLALIPAVAGG